MTRSSDLTEGMRQGDLQDLVLPLISVDEYESKIDPKAFVIGFYVQDGSAAKDLDRFLQKSPYPLLDTDVSPAPDQQGYFIVFVEILHSTQASHYVEMVLSDVASLTGITAWKMRLRGNARLIPFSSNRLRRSLAELSESAERPSLRDYLR